jgi:ATP-binding cassette subfamily F protein 3
LKPSSIASAPRPPRPNRCSRIKELEKIERIEIPEEEPVIHFKFPQPPPSGRTVVEAENLSKSYGAKQVLTGVNFTIERGDRVALVGVNGAGKSTLIRCSPATKRPPRATVKLGHNVVSEYFAQDQYKVLNGDARMLDDISRAALKVPSRRCARCWAAFSFQRRRCLQAAGRALGRRAQPLRAGAHSGFAVEFSAARRAHQPPRHARQGRAARGHRGYSSGTVVFVSHDRYFIDRLATRVLEVEGGTVTSHEAITKTICAAKRPNGKT